MVWEWSEWTTVELEENQVVWERSEQTTVELEENRDSNEIRKKSGGAWKPMSPPPFFQTKKQ